MSDEVRTGSASVPIYLRQGAKATGSVDQLVTEVPHAVPVSAHTGDGSNAAVYIAILIMVLISAAIIIFRHRFK